MNWAYQMIYYGARMWLVFVLHSFSLGSFGELITVITDIFYLGLLGLGILFYFIVLFYLGIQIYVYISFSLSFLHSTVLLLLSNSFHFTGYSLIPVSLVDFSNLNMILYIIIFYFFLLLLIPLLLSNINYTYHYISSKSLLPFYI